MAIKEEFKAVYQQRNLMVYSIALGYRNFCGVQPRVQWERQVWSRWNHPKHSFILWLAIQDRLATKARVNRFLQVPDSVCVFCRNHDETTEHLFFKCNWTREGLQGMQEWLMWQIRGGDLRGILKQCQSSKLSKIRRQVLCASVAALVYNVWKARNMYIWAEGKIDLANVMVQVKRSVKNRIILLRKDKRQCIDDDWLNLL